MILAWASPFKIILFPLEKLGFILTFLKEIREN